MKRRIAGAALLLAISGLTYSEVVPEIGLYSFSFNKSVKTDGTKVYIFNGRKYLELQNLLTILEITNNNWINEIFTIDKGNIYGQEKQIDLEKKVIKSKGKNNLKYTDQIIEKKEKIYIELDYLKNIIDISYLDVDEDKLNIDIETGFQLPAQLSNIREYRKEQFLAGDTSAKKEIPEQRKLFEPGNLRLTYNYNKSFQAYNSESKYINGEYYGPLLYGELEVYQGIYPELENYQTRLMYRDVYKDHDITFGDSYIRMPEVLSGTVSSVRGITFSRNDRIASFEEDAETITITGEAPLGKFVELYRNGQLLSYEDVKGGRYLFEKVPQLFSSDSFYVIIYNQDGSIVKENLRREYDSSLEKKGEFGYNIHMGEADYTGYYQFVGEVNYGLTNTITLKTGYYDLKYDSYWYGKTQSVETTKLGILHVSNFSKYPYSIEFSGYSNSSNGGEDFYYKYNQQFETYKFYLEGGTYSKFTQNRIGKENELALELNKNKFLHDRLNLGLKYYSTKYTGNDKAIEEVGAVLRASFRNYTTEYGIYKNLDSELVQHDASIRSYHFRDYILYAGVRHKTIRDYDETRYKLEVTSKRNTDNGLRYRAYYEKSLRYGDVFGVAFDIDYNDWFTGNASYQKDNGRSYSSTGFTLDKVINLADVNSSTNAIENGRIGGIVYVDNNGNGKYDEGIDRPLPRTEVSVRGTMASTDEKGRYKLSNLYPGVHTTKFETQNPLYKAEADQYKVRIAPATTTVLNIPMKSRKIVSGNINIQNDMLKHSFLKTLMMSIYDLEKNQKIEVVIPEKDGFFMIENLTGGKYKLVLESINIPGKELFVRELEIGHNSGEILMDLNIIGNDEKSLSYELEMY